MTLDDPVVALLRRGLQARREGRLTPARADFEAALRLRPGHPDALHLLGELAQAEGRLDEALDLLTRSLQSRPMQPPTWSRLGSVHEALGHHGLAAAAWERAISMQPTPPDALYNLARLRRTEGRAAEAAALVEQAARHDGASAVLRGQAWQLRALLHDEAGELDAARAALDCSIAAAPKRPAAHHNRAVLLHRQGRHAESLASHDQALALGLDAAVAHYNRGNALQALGRTDDAVAAYRTALARDPLLELALYDLARLRWRRGDADFTEELEAAAGHAPQSPAAHGILGRLLLLAGRADAALTAYDAALARAEAVAGYHDGRGQALARLGRAAEAVEAHRRAVALAPDDAAAAIGLARALLQVGDAAQAAGEAARAIGLAPWQQEAWAVQGLAWRVLGDPRAEWLAGPGHFVRAYDIDLPHGWTDVAAFNAALAQWLESLHTDVQAPIDQTLRQGSQTVGQLFDRTDPLLVALRGGIARAVDRHVAWLATLPDDASHPLLGRRAAGWRFTDSWSSRLRSGGFHTRHVHPHGWISSCYYVALPPVVSQASPGESAPGPGWITFGEPDLIVPGLAPGPQRAVQPRVGRLVLFPSYLWHATVPFDDEAARLTVAFDIVPRG